MIIQDPTCAPRIHMLYRRLLYRIIIILSCHLLILQLCKINLLNRKLLSFIECLGIPHINHHLLICIDLAEAGCPLLASCIAFGFEGVICFCLWLVARQSWKVVSISYVVSVSFNFLSAEIRFKLLKAFPLNLWQLWLTTGPAAPRNHIIYLAHVSAEPSTLVKLTGWLVDIATFLHPESVG